MRTWLSHIIIFNNGKRENDIIFYYLIYEVRGIWTLVFLINETNQCVISYKTLGKKIYIYIYDICILKNYTKYTAVLCEDTKDMESKFDAVTIFAVE